MVDHIDDTCHKRNEHIRLCHQDLEGLGLLFGYIKDARGLLENGFQHCMGVLGRRGIELDAVVVLRVSLDGTVHIDRVRFGSWCWAFWLVVHEGMDVVA